MQVYYYSWYKLKLKWLYINNRLSYVKLQVSAKRKLKLFPSGYMYE